MKFDIASAGDFAKAVAPDKILGPLIVGDVTAGDSHRCCLEYIIKKLESYDFHPTLFTNKDPITEIRGTSKGFGVGHSSFQSKRSTYIYCGKCFNNVPQADNFSCCVIASTSCEKLTDVEKGERFSVELLAVYPHSSQCTMKNAYRRNFKMDRENGGRGWDTFEFPIDEICRGTYNNICEKLDNVGEDGDHYGKKLNELFWFKHHHYLIQYIPPPFYRNQNF